MTRRTAAIAAAALAALLLAAGAHAKTLRTADQGDAVSMDPHSLNETTQLTFDATTQRMKCPYCGHLAEAPIARVMGAVREIPLEAPRDRNA